MEADVSERVIRRPGLREKTGLSDGEIDKLENAGTFPRRISIGGTRMVGWVASEVDAWIARSIAERDDLVQRRARLEARMPKPNVLRREKAEKAEISVP
jgi:prophage regulatory protein